MSCDNMLQYDTICAHFTCTQLVSLHIKSRALHLAGGETGACARTKSKIAQHFDNLGLIDGGHPQI